MSTARLVFAWYACWVSIGAIAGIFIDQSQGDFVKEWLGPALAGGGAAVVLSSGIGAVILVVRDMRHRSQG